MAVIHYTSDCPHCFSRLSSYDTEFAIYKCGTVIDTTLPDMDAIITQRSETCVKNATIRRVYIRPIFCGILGFLLFRLFKLIFL